MAPHLAGKVFGMLQKIINFIAALVVRFFSPGSPGALIAPYLLFLVLSAAEIGAWACIALETQWAEAFLNGLALSAVSKAFLSFGHDLFVISAMIHLQWKFSDGPIGMVLRVIFRRLNRNRPEEQLQSPMNRTEGDVD